MTRRSLASLALCSALACASVDRLLENEPKPSPEAGAWAEQRERWTRKASLYDGLAMRALATATWQSPEVRRTRAERTAQWKAMTDAERDALLAAERADAAKYDDFVLSITTGDPADNDLDSKETAWRVAIVVPGAPDVVGAQVEALRADALLRTLYPYIGDFDTVYRIRFPHRADVSPEHPPTLRLAGPRGRIDFDFARAAPAGVKSDAPTPAP